MKISPIKCIDVLKILAIPLFVLATQATGAILEGYVLDSESNQPLSGVNVELTDTNLTTTTNSEGYYSFFDDSPTNTLYRDPQGKLFSPMQNTLITDGKLTFVRSVAMASIFQLTVFDLRGTKLYNDFISCSATRCTIQIPDSDYSGIAFIRLSEFGAQPTGQQTSKPIQTYTHLVKPGNGGGNLPDPIPSGSWNVTFSKSGYNTLSTIISEGIVTNSYLVAIPSPANYTWTPDDCHVDDSSVELANLVNNYREENGLGRIPLSGHLFLVAELHTRDLYFHDPDGPAECNLHSWSDQSDAFGYTWSAVCYQSGNNSSYPHMWDKPKQISGGAFTSYGYENAAMGGGSPEGFLNLWKSSPAHNAVILETGMWSSHPWKALGASIYQNNAVLWFADDTDPKPLTLCP